MKTIEVLPKAAGFNKCINGGLYEWQRGVTFTSIASGTYCADRFRHGHSMATAVVDVNQQTDSPNDATVYSLRYDVTTAQASIGVAEYMLLDHYVEGYNSNSLYGKSIVVSFWVKSNKTGTYCVALRNSVANRSYVAEYQISSSGVWTPVTIVIPHEVVGVWETTTGGGLLISFILAGGTNYDAAADTWVSSNKVKTTNQVNFLDSTSNYIQFAQIMIHKGRYSVNDFSLFGGDISQEQNACRRYYVDSTAAICRGFYFDASTLTCNVHYPTLMRVAPSTILYYDGTDNVVRSHNSSATVSATVTTENAHGFEVIGGGTYTSGHSYHFSYRSNADY